MKQHFSILGMTCNGCVASVHKKLEILDGVTLVSVNLEQEEAIVEADRQLTPTEVQEVLSPKYKVSSGLNLEKGSRQTAQEQQTPSKLRQLWPLLLIFCYLISASVFLNYQDWNPKEAMLDFMGLFYVVFSFFKFLDVKGFSQSFQMYDPLAKRISAYAWSYPFLELALGVLFLTRILVGPALIATIILLGITTVGVVSVLRNKKAIQCACLGTALKLPMTEATFIENAIMLIMAIAMLIF